MNFDAKRTGLPTKPKLTEAQASMLDMLSRSACGWTSARGRWVWSTPSGTRRIYEALVRKGLVEVDRHPTHKDYDVYRMPLRIYALCVINHGFRLVAVVDGRAYLRSSGRNKTTPEGEFYPIAGALPTWIVKTERGKSAVDPRDVRVCRWLEEAFGGDLLDDLKAVVLPRHVVAKADRNATFDPSEDRHGWASKFNEWLRAHGCMGRRDYDTWCARGVSSYWPFDIPE